MKKLLLLLIFLICNNTYSQLFFSEQDSEGYVLISKNNGCTYCECLNCNGKGKYLKDFWVTCYHCKDWAESYRNARGCDVCKNKKGKYEARYTKCIICAGKGKFHNRYGSDENIEKREVENNNQRNQNNSQNSEDKRPFRNPELKKAKLTGTIYHNSN